MNNGLLAKLAQAQTDEERTWIVTESLLSTLSPELTAAVWAVAIPHWFNVDILAALRPELQTQASQLYEELLTLPFVEVFPERGYNVHELTRRMMLDRLWHEDRDEFITLSERAAEYFSKSNERKGSITAQPETQIEWLYHLVVVDSEWKGSELWDVAQTWVNNFRIAELESLIKTLLEQIRADRVATPAKAETYYWAGKAEFRSYRTIKALERYEAALAFYREVGSRLGEANTLQAIGILQENLNLGLEYCQAALELYTQIGDKYSQSRNLIYFTSKIILKLGREKEAVDLLNRAIHLAREIPYEVFVEDALARLREIQGQ
ncbi:MAG: hypothetical protein PUP92_23855 [Rhizonema sp. PD38]|nr:hypothetical protein [Rhizonema sp. PD38]